LKQAEAIDVFKTLKHRGTINVSQQIERMATARENIIPCITPAADLWSMQDERLMTGDEVSRMPFLFD